MEVSGIPAEHDQLSEDEQELVGFSPPDTGNSARTAPAAVRRHQRIHYAKITEPYPRLSTISVLRRTSSAIVSKLSWSEKRFLQWMNRDINRLREYATKNALAEVDGLRKSYDLAQWMPVFPASAEAGAKPTRDLDIIRETSESVEGGAHGMSMSPIYPNFLKLMQVNHHPHPGLQPYKVEQTVIRSLRGQWHYHPD
jgi:hypothetical protein